MVAGASAFTAGHAQASDWETALHACLEQASPMRADYTLGFVYVTDAVATDLPLILERLREATRVGEWVGSVGMAICGGREEIYHRPAISILLGAFAPDSFRVFGPVTDDWTEFETRHADWLQAHRPYFGIVHGDPRVPWVQTLVAQLSERMGDGFLVGGLSSSTEVQNQIANDPQQGGLSGVLFSQDVAVATRVTQGCEVVSRRYEVTRCDQNVVYELDGQTAMDVFLHEAAAHFGDDLRRAANSMLVALPVRGCDTGDYLVRNVLALDTDDKALVIGENVNVSDSLSFCLRNSEVAAEDLERALGELTRSNNTPPRAGVYFSCIARGANLFGPGSVEMGIVHRTLGEIPLTGFYANGEISNNRVYTYTGVLSVFF